MIKYICDICGKEITTTMNYTKYKLKKEDYDWTEKRWINLLLHDSCWHSMCDYIKNSQSKEGEHSS